MNTLSVRTAAIIIHAIANFLLVTYLLAIDITGSWLYFIGFILIIALLLYLFIKHLVSYIYFIKIKTK
jgi:hypothetical protein